MSKEQFIEELYKLGIKITDKELNDLNKYYELLIEWNSKMNLTAITDINDVYLKHFYDSATIAKVVDLNKINNICDVGTGAGFPGIVIKILYPNINITLVDSLEKRCKFLKEVIISLNLKNIEVYHDRAEDFAKKHREEFDIVTSRAVATLPTLLEYSIPMTKINGLMIALKGNVEEELNKSSSAIKKLDIKLVDKCEFRLPQEESIRNILVFQKLKKTNIKYPRTYAEIKKNSL